MRVLQVIDHLVGGGQERVAAELAAALVGQVEYSACLATRGGGDYEPMVRDAGAGLFLGGRTSRTDVRSWGRMLRWVRGQRFDVVHVHNPGSLPAMAAFQKVPGVSFKLVMHLQMLTDPAEQHRADTERWHRRHRDAVAAAIVTNSGLRDYLIDDAGYAPEKVHVVVNPVDFAAWDRAAAVPAPDPAWPDDDRPTVVMVAQWRAQKDHPVALQAARRVKDRGFDARWVFIGTEDPELTGPARATIAALGLQDDVVIAGRRSDVPALLRRADVGVLATHYEGLPVALIEYCAAALPSVVSEVDGTHDQIAPEDGIIGVPEGDVQALADRVSELLADDQRRIELGRRAHESMLRQADTPVVVGQVRAIYDAL